MSEKRQQAIEEWISRLPAKIHPAVTEDDKGYAMSNGLFFGVNTSDPDPNQDEWFYKNPKNLPDIVSTILNHAQNLADFHPAIQTGDDSLARYKDYISEIDKVPFLALASNEDVTLKQFDKNYDTLVDNILSLYKNAETEDQYAIAESVANLAKSTFSVDNKETYKAMFSQATVDNTVGDATTIVFRLYYTLLYMKHEVDGKSEVSEQTATVKTTEYNVLFDYIAENASKLAKLSAKKVDDWIKDMDTPVNTDRKACFEK